MNWNLLSVGLIVLILVIWAVVRFTRKQEGQEGDVLLEEHPKDSTILSPPAVDLDAAIQSLKSALKKVIDAAFEKELPDPRQIGEQFSSDSGWVVAKGTVHFHGIGSYKLKMAKLPAGQVGMETSGEFEMDGDNAFPHLHLTSIVGDISDQVSEVTRMTRLDDVWKRVMTDLLVYARIYFESRTDEFNAEVFKAMAVAGFDSVPYPSPSSFAGMYFSNELTRKWDNAFDIVFPKPRREFGDWLFYSAGTTVHRESELTSATPDKFEEFDVVQDIRLQEARDYIQLLLNESLTHPDNVTRFGNMVNECLSHQDSLIRKLDRKFDIHTTLDGVLGVCLDIDMSGSRIEVDVRVNRLAFCLNNVYTREDFMRVLNEQLRHFLDSAMRQQFDGWSVDATGEAVDTGLEPCSDRRGPHFQYSYWLTNIPPHRRNHDSDSQA